MPTSMPPKTFSISFMFRGTGGSQKRGRPMEGGDQELVAGYDEQLRSKRRAFVEGRHRKAR